MPILGVSSQTWAARQKVERPLLSSLLSVFRRFSRLVPSLLLLDHLRITADRNEMDQPLAIDLRTSAKGAKRFGLPSLHGGRVDGGNDAVDPGWCPMLAEAAAV